MFLVTLASCKPSSLKYIRNQWSTQADSRLVYHPPYFPFSHTSQRDSISDVLAYGVPCLFGDVTPSLCILIRFVRTVMEGPPRQLLEAVAEDICQGLLKQHSRLSAVSVAVSKISVPGVPAILDSVGEHDAIQPETHTFRLSLSLSCSWHHSVTVVVQLLAVAVIQI